MIFVTTGAQMPFPRLIRAVDLWAGQHPEREVFAQIGDDEVAPMHMQWTRFLAPEQFRDLVSRCELIVAHAGMGTIISGLLYGKRIIVLPRLGRLNETRNDHQVATAQRLEEAGQVEVAWNEQCLAGMLARPANGQPGRRISDRASDELLFTIETFVNQADLKTPARLISRMTGL